MAGAKGLPRAEEIPEPVRHARCIKAMSFRSAREQYHIGYETWKAIRAGSQDAWVPSKGGRRLAPATIEEILADVKARPELNTAVRAHSLGMRTATVQAVLTRNGLNRSPARMRFAGYQVDVVRPLEIARKRRILATAPGALTQIDWKTFGVVRRRAGASSVRACGCVIVDHLTAYGTVLLHPVEDGEASSRALVAHAARVPFKLKGLLLSDNGKCFLSDEYLQCAAKLGLHQRTTRFNHPWSNGKAEALNKILKNQCFPAICTGFVRDLEQLQQWVDAWMDNYNHKRAHSGWINKGLPPHVMWQRWKNEKGSRLQKLCKLGLVRPEDVEYTRVMGTDVTGTQALTPKLSDSHGVPYVLVIDRSGELHRRGKTKSTFREYRPDPRKNFAIAK